MVLRAMPLISGNNKNFATGCSPCLFVIEALFNRCLYLTFVSNCYDANFLKGEKFLGIFK